MVQKLVSSDDSSVNWTWPLSSGIVECRFVQRSPEYFVVYLSSQIGCSHYCSMCHLTATGQTMDEDISPRFLFDQADFVLAHAAEVATEAKAVHFNFMARGEPLASQEIKTFWACISDGLRQRSYGAWRGQLRPEYLISTILPASLDKELVDIFPVNHPEIYWSLYSVRSEFRKRWLPKAMEVEKAAALLARWQYETSKIPKIHYAFINDENDTDWEMLGIIDLLKRHKLRVNFNVVRYNPPNPGHSRETSLVNIRLRMNQFQEAFPEARVDLIDRVGYDVKASCGMFVTA